MSYKYSNGGFTVQGDIKAADDAERNTIIDFGEDLIQLQTSGSTRLHIDNDGVYIPDTNADTSLRVSGAVEITPGNNAGLTFKKGESELNFISFKNASDGASYNARLAYQAAEHLFIAPGRGADFYINSSQNSGDATFPFRIMDDGTARFEKGLTDGSTSSTNLDSSISFYVSGTMDGNNNALFMGNVVMSSSLIVETGISYEDVIMAELTIPGVQAQTDTDAFSFDLPYGVTFHKLVTRATRNVGNSGDTTVTVANGAGTTLATTTITSAQAVGRTTTTSISSGNQTENTIIRFAITAVGSNVQDLRANLFFKRNV